MNVFEAPHGNRDPDAPTATLARLPGIRFCVASEATQTAGGKTVPLYEKLLKKITGGDAITARSPHAKKMFEFQPQCKLWLSMDKPPQARDASLGFWERIRYIPCLVSFATNPDRTLKDRLKLEAEGILAWIVRGALAWRTRRLTVDVPAAVLNATAQLKRDNEPVSDFLNAKCVVDAQAEPLSASALYMAYTSWYQASGKDSKWALTQNAFGRSMSKLFEKKQTAKGAVYLGIRYKTLLESKQTEV
jgi:putative DNA primase/helicase